MTRVATLGLLTTAALTLMATQTSAAVAYMRSTEGQPWGVSTNEAAMDAVFGVGGWQDLRYETANPLTVFSASNTFIFMEGGDFTADELEAFLVANLSTIEAWVAAGGSLFLNSAPNEGDGMYFGFGVTLNPIYNFEDPLVQAVNPAHPIFNGPFTPVTTIYTGTSFAHTDVGGSYTPLLQDPLGDTFLAEKDYGAGHAILGGMTTTNFHSPEPHAFNLRANLLVYGAAQAGTGVVPEPASLAIWGVIGAIGLAVGVARRSRRAKQAI